MVKHRRRLCWHLLKPLRCRVAIEGSEQALAHLETLFVRGLHDPNKVLLGKVAPLVALAAKRRQQCFYLDPPLFIQLQLI